MVSLSFTLLFFVFAVEGFFPFVMTRNVAHTIGSARFHAVEVDIFILFISLELGIV